MEPQENPNPEMPQDEASSNTSETKPIAKNPWWVKAMPHYFIIYSVLDQICNPNNLLNIFVIFIWIYLGVKIQRNKIVFSSFNKVWFLLLAIIVIPELIDNIKQLIHLYLPLF